MDDSGGIGPGGKVVARGYLGSFSTAAVLQALSISRQYTAVHFYLRDRSAAGRVLLKSGMVLGAELVGSERRGLDALHALLQKPLYAFKVERLIPPTEYPAPIAQLSTRLLSAMPQPIPSEPTAASAPAAAPEPVQATARADVAVEESVTAPIAAPSSEARAGAAPIVAIASPKGGCGKTTIALNLAASLARSGLRVVLADCDPNGDVLSAVAARDRAQAGIFDALAAGADPSGLAVATVLERLQLVPALGPGADLPDNLVSSAPVREHWQGAFRSLSANADIVLVDTAAGMFGLTGQVLAASSHVLGVLQAESISQRSFGVFDRVLGKLEHAPEVLGVVLNMIRRDDPTSLSVLVDASSQLPEERLLQISIPRSDVFAKSSAQGVPVAYCEGDDAGIARLFDALAVELVSRLRIEEPERPSQPASFVV